MDAGKQSSSTIWTREAVREYEVALVAYIEGHHIHVPWEKVAAYLPGRTVAEVKEHYDELVEGICRTHPYALSLSYCHLPEDSAAGCSDGNMGSVVEPTRDQGEITSTAESDPGQGNDTMALVAYIEGHHIHVPWEKVAAYLPGRTVAEVKEHYDELVEGICRTHPYALSLSYCHLPEDSAAGCSVANRGSVDEPRRDQEEIKSAAEGNPGQRKNTSGDSVITEEHHPSEDDEQGQEAGSKAP